jgi:DNA-binding MarR family transcriptional regulator
MNSEKQQVKPVKAENQIPCLSADDVRRISHDDYCLLSAWRDSLRGFMTASKSILKQARVTPAQYQALLAIHLRPRQEPMTMGSLARHLHIKHNSAVTLVNHMAARGLVRRVPSTKDSRVVHLRFTAKGEAVLRKLVSAHRLELISIAPVLQEILAQAQ